MFEKREILFRKSKILNNEGLSDSVFSYLSSRYDRSSHCKIEKTITQNPQKMITRNVLIREYDVQKKYCLKVVRKGKLLFIQLKLVLTHSGLN